MSADLCAWCGHDVRWWHRRKRWTIAGVTEWAHRRCHEMWAAR